MDYSNQSNLDFNQTQQSSFEDIKPKPENNLVLAIIGTILGLCSPCCIGLIVGIVAIVFSNQVNTKYAIGDYVGAEKASKNSKILLCCFRIRHFRHNYKYYYIRDWWNGCLHGTI
ncbi:CD225/dispanin family protein [Empedobacter brevis]|uniref:CD225/dispanin family protein n=1 Tax=Empedobacter brevis TaxID=247 RepID=UPI0039B0AF9B